MTFALRAEPAPPPSLTLVLDPRDLPDDERYASFAAALDAVRRSAEARVGEEDLAYITRVERASKLAEVVGRLLIHFSVDPVTFAAGVGALWVHKQLEATEIGHTVLHGAFDRIPGEHRYRSKGFDWKMPIDERSWDRGHNKRHHGATNVAGHDPDIHFGPVRLTEHTPHHEYHRAQLPFSVLIAWPNFALAMNLHFTGMLDLVQGNGREEQFDFIAERSWSTARDCVKRFARKAAPYYAKEYLLYPTLAGPFFWKVALGNWMAETMRDFYTAATVYCGHIGEDTARYPEGTKPTSRGHWYAMQVEASNDFDVPWVVSVLCGALDRQIEHHLFPRLPTERLREIAPEVRAICERHGVQYRRDSWPRTLAKALRRIGTLSRADA